jgi:hypothetical protein
MKTVCTLLIFIAYVHHNARFKKRKTCVQLVSESIILKTPPRNKKKLPFQPLYYKIKEEFCRSNNVGTKGRTDAAF